jgi:small-conductance mechanosensitive channel
MGVNALASWFTANHDGLMLGLAVGAAMVAVMLVLRGLGQKIVSHDPHGLSLQVVLGRVLAKTSILFMIIAAAEVVASYADLPRKAAHLIDIAFVIAFALQGAVWGRELILGVISRRVAEDGSALASAMAIIRVLISVALFAIAGILILDNLGVNVTALVAGLGIGGIAIGLAAQGIFSDLFAALAILFDKPFKRGDTIRYDNSTGTVERIGLKTTRLRSLTGEQLIMANTKLLEREIHNLAAARARRMTLYFAVASKTPSARLAQVEVLANQAMEQRRSCKFVRCAAVAIGSGAVAFELVYDDRDLDNNGSAANRSAILLDLVERLRAEKIDIVRASDAPPPLAPF